MRCPSPAFPLTRTENADTSAASTMTQKKNAAGAVEHPAAFFSRPPV